MENEIKSEKRISCPICGSHMDKQEYITNLIEKYRCNQCNSELKYPLIRPNKNENDHSLTHPITENCEKCKNSNKICDRCGDFVCEEHLKNTENVKEKFTETQKALFEKIASKSKNVCISCLLSIIFGVKQKNVDNYNSIVEKRHNKRNFPWLIFLPILALIGFLMSKFACK